VAGGGTGGKRTLAFRYANEGNARPWQVLVNGSSQETIRPKATGRVDIWASFDWPATLRTGNNTVRVVIQQAPA
jgi:hypothetical protein